MRGPDLVELAGVDALIERAQQKFDAGDAEQALHLLDIVFTTQPGCGEAMTLAITVHQKLLSEADNFWLNGWLANQIKVLKGGQTAALSFD